MTASLSQERRPLVIASLSIFVLALVIRLWFNFVFRHPDASLACDAYEYVSTANALVDALNVGNHQQIFSTASDGLFTKILSEGPLFPLCLVACQIIAGTTGSTAAVVWQCIVSSLTCVLLLFVGKSLWSRNTGLVAGVIAAVYPGFIVATGRVLPETLACFLITLCTLLLVAQRRRRPDALCMFLAGVSSVCLEFAKSALMLATFSNAAFAGLLSVRYRSWKLGLFFVSGLLVALIPWMLFQGKGTGEFKPFVDRASHLNCAVGNNVRAEGWSIEPYPNYGGIESESLAQIVRRSIKVDPLGWVELTAGKVARLTKFPWNDFRTSIGIAKFRAQVVFHQILLMLACIGCIWAVPAIKSGAPSSHQNVPGRLLVVVLICVHFAYIGFVALPRYFVTAMPLVVLLSSAALVYFFRAMSSHPKLATKLFVAASCLWFIARANVAGGTISMFPFLNIQLILFFTFLAKFAFLLYACMAVSKLVYAMKVERITATALMALVIIPPLPSLCLPLSAHGRWYEKRVKVTIKDPLKQTIVIPSNQFWRPDRVWYLMIDADGWSQLRNLDIALNGLRLEEPIIPGLAFADVSNKYDAAGDGLQKPFEHIYASLANPAGKSLDDLRQWFFIPISNRNLTINNVVHVTPNPGETELFTTYRRDLLPSLFRSSWDKAFYGSDWERGLSDTRLEDRLDSWNRDSELQKLSREPGRSWQVRIVSVPLAQSSGAATAGDPKDASVKPAGWKNCFAVKDATVISEGGLLSTHQIALSAGQDWLVRVKGRVNPGAGVSTYGISLSFTDASKKTVYASWLPSKAAQGITTFDLAFPVTNLDKDICEAQVVLSAEKKSNVFRRPMTQNDKTVEFRDIEVGVIPFPKLILENALVF